MGSIGYVVINEATTVATAYSLAGFMTDVAHVSTSTTNTVGLNNAFATFNNLVNLNTGNALKVTPAYAGGLPNTTPDTFRSIVPYDTINTIADALAGCVNTNGAAPACSSLFAITGNKNGETTLDAALYIAHNPGLGIARQYQYADGPGFQHRALPAHAAHHAAHKQSQRLHADA